MTVIYNGEIPSHRKDSKCGPSLADNNKVPSGIIH